MNQIKIPESLSYIGAIINGKFYMDIEGGANPTVKIYPKILRKHGEALKNIQVYL